MKTLLIGTALAAVGLLAGCASAERQATFVTKTSLSLVDIDSTPPSASLGYQRIEGYFGPRLSDGSAVPVAGFFFTDGSLLGRSLQQVFATGCAAEVVSGAVPAAAAAASAPAGSACAASNFTDQPRPMLFATGTTLGIGFGLTENNAPTLTLGYRRKEASIIPVDPGAMPSVLAMHGNVVKATSEAGRPAGDVGITQYFATGRAAVAWAGDEEVQRSFRRNTETALGTYRDNERLQSLHALTTLGCLAAVRDDRLGGVWRNAEALGLLRGARTADALQAMPPAKAREDYTRFLVVLDADSAGTTTLMELHRRFVCTLSKQG